jgi:tetratricopeptide (TPR) repeat protein
MMIPMSGGFAFPSDHQCDDVLPLLPLMYAEEISADDRARILSHLETCASCHYQYRLFGDIIAACQRLLADDPCELDEPDDDLYVPSFQDILRAADALQDEQEHTSDPPDQPSDGFRLLSMRRQEKEPLPFRVVSSTRSSLPSQSDSSLAVSDAPAMWSDPAYSPEAADSLVRAYVLGGRHKYHEATQYLEPLLNVPMAHPQRLRVNYYLGLCHAALDDYSLSTRFLDEAVEWAMHGENMLAVAQICHALGENHYATLQCASAIEYYTIALDAFDALESGDASDQDRDLQDTRITSLIRLASQHFLLSDFEEAKRHIAATQAMITSSPGIAQSALHRASVAWLSALLSRWIGDPIAGLKDVFDALDIYTRMEQHGNLARIQIVVADNILDIVDRHGVVSESGTALANFADMAEPHIMQALQQTRYLADMPGEYMAGLAHIRLLRATQNTEYDRLTILADMIQQATQAGQTALLGQGYTALGDEFISRNELDQARQCYRSALDVLAGTDIPAYTVFARRALYQIDEGLVAPHANGN